MTTNTDRIEKRVFLRATPARVWRAISSADEFSAWFGVKLEAPFAPGVAATGYLTMKGYEHRKMSIDIERIEPEHYFSFRWHPFAIDPQVDYSDEAPTLVEFKLTAADGGTSLTIIETGFDKLPHARRADAFRMNDSGWSAQAESLARHVEA